MKSSLATPRRILLVIGSFALVGAGFACWLRGTFAGTPNPAAWFNAFFVLFARDEVTGLAVVAAFSAAAGVYFFRGRPPLAERVRLVAPPKERAWSQPTVLPQKRTLLVACIAAGVFAIAALGTEFVCHEYALSADEFMADFQARIFLHGKITAEVPARWIPAVRVILPTYVDYLPQTHSWKAAYLPVYAAMRAVLQSVHLQSLLNPLLAALTILALYGTARNLWPNDQENALVAILLLAVSAQFLCMAMTGYAMPAHLALNMVWLWLYSRPDRRRFYLAPVVGVMAIGLHQPIVHALFAAPFLWRLVWARKWRAVLIFGFIYSLGCGVWFAWRVHYAPATNLPIQTFFRLLNPRMSIVQPMDLLLVIGWSGLATPLLAALGFGCVFRSRRSLGKAPNAAELILRDAAFSSLLTFGFYYFFYLDQGHGWGYRYFHGSLGCLILVATSGWAALVEKAGHRNARHFLLAGLAASLLIVLPLRCYQVETFVRPFARASAAIHALNLNVVGVDPHFAWYSADLIRNDPFLENRPVVVALINLRPKEVATLQQAGAARFMQPDELARFGLATVRRSQYRYDPFRLGRKP